MLTWLEWATYVSHSATPVVHLTACYDRPVDV